MVKGRVNGRVQAHDYVPPFSRDLVILRDRQMCMYCGNQFRLKDLTIDHVVPLAQNGETSFKNCVCSCKRCNNLKGNRKPEQWGYHLLAVPYELNYAERLFLENRHIIYDQTEFLVKRFRKNSSLKSLIT
jgi:5-methylcytosine-specific restriction endonuclease McrA